MRTKPVAVLAGAVPAYALAVSAALIGILATVTVLPWPGAVIGVAASIATALFPRRFGSWVLLLLLAGSVFLRPLDASEWRNYVTLFAVHAIHTLTCLLCVIPRGTRIAAPLWHRMLGRFVLTQVCAQLLLFTLSALAVLVRSSFGGWPWLAPVSVVLLISIIAVLIRPTRRGSGTGARLFRHPRTATLRAQHDVGEDS